MIQIQNAVTRLNRIFHSEDDFQHELAWELHSRVEQQSEWEVRLEYPAQGDTYIDICLISGESIVPVELKYKTTEAQCERDGEVFNLKEHSARPTGRYEFIRDIDRIEKITEGTKLPGFAIFLTNDAGYWEPLDDPRTANGDAFRIHEGRVLEGTLDWREYKDYMPNKRCRPISLQNRYQLQWEQYAHAETSSNEANDEFRYLVVSTRDV